MSKTRFLGNLIKTNPTIPTGNSGANYGTATGVWNLEEAASFKAAGDWPLTASAPSAPSITSVTAGVEQVTVAFNAGSSGGLDITSFTATASSGETASGSSSPLTVTSLAAGTAITFTVTATNNVGTSSASSASSSVTPNAAARGLFFGGNTGSTRDEVIQYITITSTGNATDFGNLTHPNVYNATLSSATRGISSGGYPDVSTYDQIEYVTIASTGNATDFGSLNKNRMYASGAANSTRGMIMCGYDISASAVSQSEYITIASLGNGTNFGDIGQMYSKGAVASPTRMVTGTNTSFTRLLIYQTIASPGAAFDFGYLVGGDSTYGKTQFVGCNSETRGLFIGGNKGSTFYKDIDYITIASTGNGTDFGDITTATRSSMSSSSNIRGIVAGGYTNTAVNTIEYVTIGSTGNASDFGDLTAANYVGGIGVASSDHGGLQ